MVSNATTVKLSFLDGQASPVLLVSRSSLLIKHSMLVNTITGTTTGSGSYCEGAAINCEFSVLNIEQSEVCSTGWTAYFLVMVVR